MNKKNILILVILLSVFVFLPYNVLGKEFKQINQTFRNQNSELINHTDTYKLSN